MADRIQDDYGQVLTVTTTDMNLGTAVSVRLHVRLPNGLKVIWTPDAVVGEAVTYTFQEGDLDQAGIYYGEVEATYASEHRISSPFTIDVSERV